MNEWVVGEACYILQYLIPAPIVSKMGVLPKAFKFTVEALVGMTSFIAVFINSSSDASVSTSVQALHQSTWCTHLWCWASSFCFLSHVSSDFLLLALSAGPVKLSPSPPSWKLAPRCAHAGIMVITGNGLSLLLNTLYVISFISHSTLSCRYCDIPPLELKALRHREEQYIVQGPQLQS